MKEEKKYSKIIREICFLSSVFFFFQLITAFFDFSGINVLLALLIGITLFGLYELLKQALDLKNKLER